MTARWREVPVSAAEHAARVNALAAELLDEGHAAVNAVSLIMEAKRDSLRDTLGNSPAATDFARGVADAGSVVTELEHRINALAEVLAETAARLLQDGPR